VGKQSVWNRGGEEGYIMVLVTRRRTLESQRDGDAGR
jgi:hypothetical protein